jgi:hypothetical protein
VNEHERYAGDPKTGIAGSHPDDGEEFTGV